MVNLKPLPGRKPLSSVTLIFKLPYYTHWGQSLVISGSEPILGSWNVKQALALSPVHQGDELFWCGRVAVPITFKCEYSITWLMTIGIFEMGGREEAETALPDGVQEGDAVEIHDLWQNVSEALFFRSAFKDVIFGGAKHLQPEAHPTALQENLHQDDAVLKVLVEFFSSPTYKYCQIRNELDITAEVGPNRELAFDVASRSPPRFIILSDGAFRDVDYEASMTMAKYFTAYRIDHILGFFRIWELPGHAVTGLVGKFRPSIALSQEELEQEGIWDFDRLSRPYIRQEILQEKFGSFWTVVAMNFLNEYQKLCYEVV
ncbi:4-alpha-glucanotransferase DPE2, partial [Ananas comosus]